MFKTSLTNLDKVFETISQSMSLYLPVDCKNGTDYKKWEPGTVMSKSLNTNRSPKDFFFPQTEDLVNFKVEGKQIEITDIRKECEDFVVFGVRACDVKSFEILDRRNIDKYADDFLIIYNKAWGAIPGATKLTRQHAIGLLNSLKPIIDPRLMHFAYHIDENGKKEPIGFFLLMIDLNQIYKGLNGKMHFLNKLRVLWRVKVARICDRAISLVFGIVPEHRGKGLEAGLVCSLESQHKIKRFKYKDLQLNWIGDFNPPMMKIAESAGATIYKTHITYRYLFDRNKPFTRAKLQKNR